MKNCSLLRNSENTSLQSVINSENHFQSCFSLFIFSTLYVVAMAAYGRCGCWDQIRDHDQDQGPGGPVQPLARDVTDSTNINFTIGPRPCYNEFINYYNTTTAGPTTRTSNDQYLAADSSDNNVWKAAVFNWSEPYSFVSPLFIATKFF